MRAIVCGGRNFTDKDLVFQSLDGFPDLETVIHGGARGADSLAGLYARARGIEEEVYKPEWHIYNRAAGPIRNQRMLDEGNPDMVIAFPGGRGTDNMMSIARRAKVLVVKIPDEGKLF